MQLTSKFVPPSVAASLMLAACGSSSYGTGSHSTAASTQSGASAPVVGTASNAALGATVLTDASGMTLYSLSGERGGTFICASSPCTQLWHPLRASGAGAPGGVASLGRITRPDGTQQVTYKGMPLYTFAQDRRAGDASGQGFKDVGTWSAVTVSAAGAAAAAGTGTSRSAPPAPAQSSGRSGY